MSLKIGRVQKKFLLLLFHKFSMGIYFPLRRRAETLRRIDREWEAVRAETLRHAIAALYRNKLIHMKELADGRLEITLSDRGKKRALTYQLDEIRIQSPGSWDGRWRLVMFDIPKSKKNIRNPFRFHLKKMGFYQYQKSVFVHPFPCKDEIEFLIEMYGIRPHVRQLTVAELDNDLHLKKIFGDAGLQVR
ncbi:MAG: CRISPR-associated endonuclease Cas2 [Patescibacteria group bacterium]|nr:CRISPR-associated endonuclease Cas2 [Patescibacteria group bacterium]